MRHIRHWISRKPLEIEHWFQRTINRKWPMGNQMVTWPVTSRDPKPQTRDFNTLRVHYRENSWRCYSNNRWLLDSLSWSYTVGYPSDSLASSYSKKCVSCSCVIVSVLKAVLHKFLRRYTVWVNIPPRHCCFLTFFHKRLETFNQFFTHILYVPIYARLQTFIQLSPTLTKLCHIKRDYLVHITICSKCPPSAETHAFRRLRKSLIDSFVDVVCGKSL